MNSGRTTTVIEDNDFEEGRKVSDKVSDKNFIDCYCRLLTHLI